MVFERRIVSLTSYQSRINIQKSNKLFNMELQKLSSLHQLFDDFYKEVYRLNPLQATFDGVPGYNDQLPAEDESYLAELHNTYADFLKRLKGFDTSKLNMDDEICYSIMENQIESVLKLAPFHLEYMPINQFTGLHLYMAMLGSGSSVQPFKTLNDYNAWLKRCNAFVRWTEVAIQNMRKGIKTKMVLPKILVEKVIGQLQDLIKPIHESVFVEPTRSYPDSFSESDRGQMDEGFKKMIEQQMNPALQDLLKFFQNEYLAAARSSSGINALPNGKQLYQEFIFASVTSYEDPESVYQLGLQEVNRITREMENIKAQLGFKGTLSALFEFMKSDSQFFPFKTDAAVLEAYQNVYDRIKPYLSDYFGVTPLCPFEIRKTEEFRAASASAEYVPGDINSGRPGVFYVPILNPKEINVTNDEMESLFLHEAVPGHHYQISLQYENIAVPLLRQKYWSSAFGEGWALYCESLGEMLGVLTDPYHKLGALGAEMHRAVRLVVDTGLHMGKMTREEAIAYNMAHEPITEVSAIAEIERYMSWPGQALSYKIGELKIKQLRDKYKEQLAEQFRLKDFHDAILKGGVMPLDIFEKYMDGWASNLKGTHA